MKTFYLFLSIIFSNYCYAATGNASDGELALLFIIVILMLPIALAYFIDFLKSIIHDIRNRRMLKKNLIE